MSSYLCDASHLAAVARAAATFAGVDQAEAAFSLLLDENLKSIAARYPDAATIGDWFDEGEAAFIWENVPAVTHTASELVDLVKSYRYQSCEHAEWEGSVAERMTGLLLVALEAPAKVEANAAAAKIAERQRAFNAHPTLYPKQSAAIMRRILRANFPACKFSVTTERGSMVSSVRISWMDGPSTKAVDALVRGFVAGRFDGMTDSYDYDNDKLLNVEGVMYRPGCSYVFTSRACSPAFVARAAAQVAEFWGLEAPAIRTSTYDGSGSVQPTTAQNQDAHRRTGYWWNDLVHQATQDARRFARQIAA